MVTVLAVFLGIVLGLLFAWLAPAFLAAAAIVYLEEHAPWLSGIIVLVLAMVIISAIIRRRDS
jgi:uncharacterized protein YacL